ncbi:peptide ABC transporter ATP-binding protein [Gordoniibacillus kamchatkensis]|uniref:Peptide ABC transporter ATP-binding protein n=1 Tax=Gordoniibacillus kamchatkensis TaxID=1590651 RepID=A0ABR5AJ57_9BACL|nr:dipeptide ABC transporter ATP-binding protein [Paenibacillus sp. VKM B-2647]KIL40392.1 peptide ABC transporter ATP-binding protein [Paenibacillus sp. VKM B-2647]
MNDVILDIRHLKKYYPVYKGVFKKVTGHVKAVDDVSLYVRRGETLGLVGESGCGKTTLGKCIVRLQSPTSGEMRFRYGEGGMRDILSLNAKEGFDVRKKIQIVFQDPYSSLNPVKTIYEAFDEPLRVHRMGSRAQRKEIIAQMLEVVNLRSDYMYRYPHEFSGGQRQRISIARALCIKPELIVCDEPVSALDVSIQAQVLNLMKDLQQQMNLSYVFIAHDLSVVEYMSDRIAVMYLGQVVELATSTSLYRTPRHPYTEALLSAVPTPELDAVRERIVLKGDVPSPINPPSGCRFHPRCSKCQEICRVEMPQLRKVSGTEDHYVACHLADTESVPQEARMEL